MSQGLRGKESKACSFTGHMLKIDSECGGRSQEIGHGVFSGTSEMFTALLAGAYVCVYASMYVSVSKCE